MFSMRPSGRLPGDFVSLALPRVAALSFHGDVSEDFAKRIAKTWLAVDVDLRGSLIRRDFSLNAVARMRDVLPEAAQEIDPLSERPYETEVHSHHENLKAYVYESYGGRSLFKTIPSPERNALYEVGAAIFSLFKVKDCEGFHKAIDYDKNNYSKASHLDSKLHIFSTIWAHAASPVFHNNDASKFMFKTIDWIDQNIPSGKNGFNLPKGYLNGYDFAGNTPLHNLAPTILPDELDTLLSRGADLFKPQARGSKTPFDILAARPDSAQFRTVLPEKIYRPFPSASKLSCPQTG